MYVHSKTIAGDRSDISELATIRLVQVVLQDALMVIIETNLLWQHDMDLSVVPVSAVVMAIVSMATAYAFVSMVRSISVFGVKFPRCLRHELYL